MSKLVRLLAVPALLMNSRSILKLLGASAALVAFTVLLVSFKTPRVNPGPDDRDQDERKFEIGLAIAPVPLHFDGKDR